tara:strand:- start:11485 stop:11904 length:420 start_codon:yes stop_codon:yes gene_type:complete
MNNMETEQNLKVYYDGLCVLCGKEMDHYRRQAGSESIEFIDICANGFDAAKEGLDPLQVHKIMHVRRRDGSLATRVDAFIEIWSVLPKYKLVAVVAKNAVVHKGLDLGYSVFAKIRPFLPRNKAADLCKDSPYCEVNKA